MIWSVDVEYKLTQLLMLIGGYKWYNDFYNDMTDEIKNVLKNVLSNVELVDEIFKEDYWLIYNPFKNELKFSLGDTININEKDHHRIKLLNSDYNKMYNQFRGRNMWYIQRNDKFDTLILRVEEFK